MQFTPVEVEFVQCVSLRHTTVSAGQVLTSPVRVKLIHQIIDACKNMFALKLLVMRLEISQSQIAATRPDYI